ncbi:MAG: hypothetical protein A3E01_02850 [Gammaproteobacteria bacterium RIFCSPHIGHO2_12_FULL_63_22]|nr:MAG: hypothetical protein A3E01_02850 [Gammaproteobacteria bacterium RIFCSPHIGHO2_12_FULL_63_22]
MWDGTRVDLLNDEYAIEADWSHKHYEAFGQATWYSIVTGKKPAVLLLVKDKEKEAQHIYRATAIAVRLNVTLYVEPSME